MAAASPSPLASSVEKTNGAKLSRLLIDGGTTVLRNVFDGYHPPANLAADLTANYVTLYNLKRRKVLHPPQWDLLFPTSGVPPDSKTFDITLLFLLLTNICGLAPPLSGWHKPPPSSDTSLEANLARVKLCRNELYGHVTSTGVQTTVFNVKWQEISSVLVALGLNPTEVVKLKSAPCGEDYISAVVEWVKSDEEIKSQLKELLETQQEARQMQDEDHRTLLDTHKGVEDLLTTQQEEHQKQQEARQIQDEDHRTLLDTHKGIEDLLTTQQEEHMKQQEARQMQEEDHRTLQDTHKAVEGVMQINQDTHQVVKNVLKSQQEDQRTLHNIQRAVQDVSQVHQDTQQNVLKSHQEILGAIQEVHQTQQEDRSTHQDTRKAIEDLRHIHEDTHHLVGEVLKTQQESRQTQKELRQSQQDDQRILHNIQKAVQDVSQGVMKRNQEEEEERKTVKSVKERSEVDKDEILRKLAKINTQKDIEYHAERYQEGTRVSFFERVEHWLDDRRSRNRVMVISGNAGMGKSVISAVVSKRMQEAGRLSGSHFCQHDKVRYRNGKIMLQSLACQLSDFLPEYKTALVETLSRNLGEELNNMEVKDLFGVLFEEPLSKLKDPGRNILLVIDGLDESEYQGRNELLDVIANHFTKLPSWIRFLVTTRPEINIADSLKSFNPLQLEPNDEENLWDLRLFFEKQLDGVIEQDHKEVIISELFKKSEGLILYAFLVVNYIKENVSLLTPEQLDSTLSSGISSVYQTYFQRLEKELCNELNIKEEQFLTFLSALAAAREPLPLDFVTKLMLSGTTSLADRRKVKKVIACISTLLPVRDNCIHFFHKSVKDWLTDMSLYEQHNFTVDEKEGHRILSELCTDELDDIKRGTVGSVQFSYTESYALRHGFQHMLYLAKDLSVCEIIVKKYVINLELVYAKLCVHNVIAAEDILCIQKQTISQELSKESKEVLKALIIILRKYMYHDTFTSCPQVFFQTMLNEGGSVLSSMASNLLQSKYPKIPYMEFVHKQVQQGAVLARFQCSSKVACFDVSPQSDYMVCECKGTTIQLWSLHTGELVWERPAVIKKSYSSGGAYRRRQCFPSVLSFYRSVVFHPTKEVVLPGDLSHAYTFDGDLKPLFPESNCRFTVCSISRDKTKILTDCPDDAKCIIMWSLENGSEITRTTRSENVFSFAWSRDGKLLAIYHSTGSICIVDAMDDFRTLAETVMAKVCGMIKFSPDCQSLFCASDGVFNRRLFRLKLNMAETPSLAPYEITSYEPWEVESQSETGFLLGDPISSDGGKFLFVLNKQTVLRGSPRSSSIYMLNINELRKTEREAAHTYNSNIVFSLSGETVYVVSADERTIRAVDVSSGELIAQQGRQIFKWNPLVAVTEGVLLITDSDTLELWKFDLSKCVRNWTNIKGITRMVPISEERVACETKNRVIILDTTSGEIVSTIPTGHGDLLTCNSKCQLLSYSEDSLQLLDNETTLWKNKISSRGTPVGRFSLSEQFVIIFARDLLSGRMCAVVDAFTGKILHVLCECIQPFDCAFISDEECVISSEAVSGGSCIKMFNVKSGDLLSLINLETKVTCLAACPRKRLLAIGQSNSKHGFKLIQVHLPQDNDSRKSKWALNTGNHKKVQDGEKEVCSCVLRNREELQRRRQRHRR